MDATTLSIIMQSDWEKTKGHLRALAVLTGNRVRADEVITTERSSHYSQKWRETDEFVEAFITKAENEGYFE